MGLKKSKYFMTENNITNESGKNNDKSCLFSFSLKVLFLRLYDNSEICFLQVYLSDT